MLSVLACLAGCGGDEPRGYSGGARMTGTPPKHPMGLRTELGEWILSPDRTAAFPVVRKSTIIKDYRLGKTFRLTVAGDPFSWSCESDRILYRLGAWHCVRRDGQEHIRFTNIPFGFVQPLQASGYTPPLWQPGHSAILFKDGQRYRLVSGDGKRDFQLCGAGAITKSIDSFHWSPDGRWLFYRNKRGAACVRPFGYISSDGLIHRVVDVPAAHSKWRSMDSCSAPVWSRDGASVAIVARAAVKGPLQAWLWHLPTGKLRALGGVSAGAWGVSAGGRYVANSGTNSGHVILTDTKTGSRTEIYRAPRNRPNLVFSPDSQWIACGDILLSVKEAKGMRLESPGDIGASPLITGWTDDSKSVKVGGVLRMLFEVRIDSGKGRRLWPDESDITVNWAPLAPQRVPLETFKVQEFQEEIVDVPPSAKELTPEVKALPVQIVEQ